MSTNVGAVRQALEEGDLRQAETALESISPTDTDAAILRAEILFLSGHSERALRVGEEALRRFARTGQEPAQLLLVTGACAWEMGDEIAGMQRLERAATTAAAAEDWSLVSRIQLQMLERFANDGESYSSLPLCAAAIRSVHKSANKRILTDAHVTFARLEAQRGATEQATRHLSHAERLLQGKTSWIAASAKLTSAIVSSLEGDLESACKAANAAAKEAKVTGWLKGEAIAAGNLAFFSACLGNLEEAEASLSYAEALGYSSAAFRYAIRDTRMGLALARKDFAQVEELWLDAQQHLKGVGLWYRQRATHTRIRALIAQGRPQDALRLAQEGALDAIRSHNRLFEDMFRLSIAEAREMLGIGEAAQLFVPPSVGATLGLLGVHRNLIAAALAKTNDPRATRQAAAAQRFISASGAQFEWQISAPRASTAEHPASVDADDVVTFFELAGYPQVLAQEAYALLATSGAVGGVAIVARGESCRCITTSGWTEDEVLNIAANLADRLQIRCGNYRDESWEVIAEPREGVQERCTASAIARLVSYAVTLDRYRRDEQQRCALWPAGTLETDGGIWASPQMTELLSIARRIAPSAITVLLTGETGTGKEVLARAIHHASDRASGRFVPFNCSAVPRDMLDSQLFGYRKGAFTGANEAFDGVIRAAAGGTLFLDEIGEIGPELQPKLLRFLETHEVHGLGEASPVKVDVRVIAATNADLDTLVRDGRLREDLFYRLNGVRLHLPALRERREEIPALVEHYLRAAADAQNKGTLTLADETLEYLLLYSWPGNIRQLVNETNRIAALADPDSSIPPSLLSPEIQASRRTMRVRPGDEPEISIRLDQPLNEAIEAIERVMVVRALDRAHGNFENAARLLGISRKGLFLKRRRWGMRRNAAAS